MRCLSFLINAAKLDFNQHNFQVSARTAYLVCCRGLLSLFVLLERPKVSGQLLNGVKSFFDRGFAVALLPPSLDPLLLFPDGALLCVDLEAGLALIRELISLHYQFHAAGLASAVFFGAMLTKMAPLVAIAGHSVLVVEAHRGRDDFLQHWLVWCPEYGHTGNGVLAMWLCAGTYFVFMGDLFTGRDSFVPMLDGLWWGLKLCDGRLTGSLAGACD